ncbi:THAP domain-containing protein 1 isoform X1 [Anopheles aquasalis]|uniref:THAP domain-containing protein 1 isoform X1 n=1 Tax=Anopheles aquasalis TaxID=42839 RepID=UPI00215A4036|nr:THAP domain-containing protein 1 isoform X1 [Anopheles aquasalis]
MPYKMCVAPFCKNNSKNIKRLGTVVKFHYFPQDVELARQWVTFCRKDANWRPSKNGAICSEHFTANDYQLDQSLWINNHHNLRLLKITAVPSILKCNLILKHKKKKELEKERTHKTNAPSKPADDLEGECNEPSLINEEQLEEERTHKTSTPNNSPTRSESCVNIDHLFDPLESAPQRQLNEIQQVIKALESENENLVKVNLQLRLRLKEVENEHGELKVERERIKKELGNNDRSNLNNEAYSHI